MRFVLPCVYLVLVAGIFPATDTFATKVKSRAEEIRLQGRMHTQFNTTSVDGELGSQFLVRRARFSAAVKMNDFVSGVVEPEYGMGEFALKDAFVQFDFSRSFALKIGQFKRSFDLFQLTSSNKSLVIERDLRIRGVEGLRSYSTLSEQLQYSHRDIGFGGSYRNASRTVAASFMVGNGLGPNKVPSREADGQGEMQYSGRFEVVPLRGRELTFAGNASYHPYRVTTTTSSRVEAIDPGKRIAAAEVLTIESGLSEEYSLALGVDAEYGNSDSGPHFKAGLIWGENWEVDSVDDPDTVTTDSTRTIRVVSRANAGEPPKFIAGQAIASYKHLLEKGGRLEAIEPVIRVSYADPNDEIADDGGFLVTPGFQIFLSGRAKFSFNLDLFFPEADADDAEYSFKAQSYLYF